jgi:hypothetical protein
VLVGADDGAVDHQPFQIGLGGQRLEEPVQGAPLDPAVVAPFHRLVVAEAFRQIPPSAKRADRIKIVLWDGSGLVLISKQLEGGTFRWPPVIDGAVRLTPVEFAALFDGIDWTRVQSAKRIPTPGVPA